jgi:Caspase domain
MPRKFGLSFLFLLILLLLGPDQALAEKRVALIIGNSAYKNVVKLPNPVKDSTAIADLFKKANFEVVEARQDLGVNEMKRELRDFSDKARDADVAVVFYSGHGIEVDGNNYLVPVDAVLNRDIDVEDEAVSLDRILQVIESAKRLRLVILDACRDNPFSKTMKRTLGTRSVGRGLAKVEPASSDTLIAFAAKAGSTASDGDGANSPFTAALLDNMLTPGLDLRIAFGRVRDEVLKKTSNKQEPFVYGSLGGTTVSLVPESQSTPAAASPAQRTPGQANPNAAGRRDYEIAERVGTKEAWTSFLAAHKTGLFADLARSQLAKLNAPQAQNSSTNVASAVPAGAARSVPVATAPGQQPATQSSPQQSANATNFNGIYIGNLCYGEAPNAKANCLHTEINIDQGKMKRQWVGRANGFVMNLTGEISASGDVKIEIHTQFADGKAASMFNLSGKVHDNHLDATGSNPVSGRTATITWIRN